MTVESVEELSKSLQRFSWPDYLVFIMMLVSCMCIGVYFGWQDHQKKKHHKARRGSEALDYLVGGRKMKVFPVAMSLVASFISGISLLGTSTEIYVYGTQYCFIFIAIILTGVALHYVYLPVYHELQLTSTYEYLDRRFDRRARMFGSISFMITTIVWTPIVVYVPALAFNQVTGVNIHIITPITCAICIFYTTVGGLKAVVWTDVVQTIIMLGSLIVVAVKATYEVGGLGIVLSRNYNSGRIEGPIFSLDPTDRHTFFSVAIGGWIYWLSINATNQSMIQRYLSLPSIKVAKQAVVLFTVGLITLLSFCAYNGLLIYAIYHDCDPLTTKLAKEKDQLVPLLVMTVLGEYPGLTGCFVAGVFSAALSSLSTALNSMAAVVLEDFVKPWHNDISERSTALIMRVTVVVFGIIAIALVFVVQHLGQVLQLSISMSGATLGALLGMYTIGLFIPWVGAKSALVGAYTGLITMLYIVIKAQADLNSGVLTFPKKPTSIEGCTYTFNVSSVINATTSENSDPSSNGFDQHADGSKPIHHLSYLYYTTFGVIITVVVSLCATLVFGREDPKNVPTQLLAPFIRHLIKVDSKADIANLPLSPSGVSCTTYNFEQEKVAEIKNEDMVVKNKDVD